MSNPRPVLCFGKAFRHWTPAEDERLLILKRRRLTNRAIAVVLDRPLGSIATRIKRITDGLVKFKRATSKRRCLKCNTKFNSEGSHNRVCRLCKGHEVWGLPVQMQTGVGP